MWHLVVDECVGLTFLVFIAFHQHGNTPLHEATSRGQLQVIELLLRATTQANPNAANKVRGCFTLA
jgi:ankyrin repeat protein